MPVNVKGMIADTFMQLSREKNVDKITVKDLVERCGISRQTFYYHFQDLLEVIEWSMQQAFQTLLTRSLSSDDPEAVLRDFISASAEADVLLQKLLHSQRREQIEGIMVRSVRTYLQELLRSKGARNNLSYEDTEIALSFCACGIVGLLLEYGGKKNMDREKLACQMRRLLFDRTGQAPER